MTSPVIAPPPPTPRRIPNLLHLLAFLAVTFFCLLLCEVLLAALHPHDILGTLQNQRLQLFANITCYVLALGAAMLVFPLFWRRSFSDGIAWNAAKAGPALAVLGLALGFVTQAGSSLLPIPKKLPIEKMFQAPGIIWVLTAFGVLVAPLFEEIVFRGFLLPSIAIIVDYLRLPRRLDALDEWRLADTFSPPALIFASLITSIFFALIHAPQLGFSWPAVALLMVVSLVLCYIRIRTGSVAASTLVHACYNLSVFITLFVSTGGYRHLDKL